MRIVSGKYKGKRISAPKNLPVRPTTDMAKEALFNILNNHYYFDEISVLDLFAGIGSITFEFASRGTTDITAVDMHAGCFKFLQKTSEELGEEINLSKGDAFAFLSRSQQKFDVIFADPPYDLPQEKFEALVNLIADNNLVNENGMAIIEHSAHTDLSHLEHFEQSKKYGGNCFSFFYF